MGRVEEGRGEEGHELGAPLRDQLHHSSVLKQSSEEVTVLDDDFQSLNNKIRK